MGGLPTTVTLRHGDPTHDAPTKLGFHRFLAEKLNEPSPTPEQEANDPQAADAFYARGVTWLRENTRNAKKFDVLFNENVNYGFRRNLFGLKLPGFLLNAFIVLVCLAIFWQRSPVDWSKRIQRQAARRRRDRGSTCFVSRVVRDGEESVFNAAHIYARQLLLSVHSPHLNKAAKGKPTTVKPTTSKPTRRAKTETEKNGT